MVHVRHDYLLKECKKMNVIWSHFVTNLFVEKLTKIKQSNESFDDPLWDAKNKI